MKSYLDSPLYQQMLAQTLRGGPQSQYPGQAIANGLAQALQAYSLKKYGEKQEEKQQAGNAELAKVLMPEQFQGAGYGPSDMKTLSGGGQVDAAIPQIADANADKRSQLAALLNSGVVGGETLAPMALKSLGLVAPKDPIKLGNDESLYDPNTYAPLVKSQPSPMTLGRDSRLINPETGAEMVGMAPPEVDYNKPFLPDGTPNTGYQQYEVERAKAGRASTTVNVGAERPFSQALGTGAANILEASSAAARAGTQTLNTVKQIRDAVSTGKVTAGPGTKAVQFFNQVSGGDPERLQATRAAMQGLAKLTLDARKNNKGQGAFSDKDQELLERAVSPDIDNLSLAEIETVAALAEKQAIFDIKSNAANVARARQVPGSGSVVDFFDVPEPAPYVPPKAGGGNDGWGQPRVKTR